jgi:hypothetical protein
VNGPVNATADTLNSAESTRIAQVLRESCIDIVCALGHELVLRVLGRRGTDLAGASVAAQHPVCQAHYALSLVDLVLPQEPDTPNGDKVRHTLPRILPELTAFFRALDVGGCTHLVWWLASSWGRTGHRRVACPGRIACVMRGVVGSCGNHRPLICGPLKRIRSSLHFGCCMI